MTVNFVFSRERSEGSSLRRFEYVGERLEIRPHLGLEALGNAGKLGARHADDVATFITYRNFSIRVASVEALGKMGDEGEMRVETIAHALQDPQPSVREAAATVLGNFELGEECAKRVARLLGDRNAMVRWVQNFQSSYFYLLAFVLSF